MIMHPYRPDLEGQDLSEYRDPNGKYLFAEMVTVVEEQGGGFVDYMWQWKDDPSNVVPKISYVKGVEPWGWIVGSGVYIEDTKAEIASFTRNLVWVCGGIVLVVMILGSVVVQQGIASRVRWRKAEDEARQHLLRLSHLSRLHTMKTMSTEIAHQIDQPLGTILLRTSLCTDSLSEGDPVTLELIENLEEISVQVERTAEIVRHIRDFSSRREMEKSRNDLKAIIRKVLAFQKSEINTNRVNLGFDLDQPGLSGAEPIWVLVDGTLIEQVVLNIVHNAIEAMKNGPRENRLLSIRTNVADGFARVVFEDNGPGIAENQLDTIFECFTSTKNDGLGIGLSICRSIVEEHGGRMWADAGAGRGGIFQFTLPIDD